jgi:hypothetical protein
LDALPSDHELLEIWLGEVELSVDPGVYRIAMYNLKGGAKCVTVATRTEELTAKNELADGASRYGQSLPGRLMT